MGEEDFLAKLNALSKWGGLNELDPAQSFAIWIYEILLKAPTEVANIVCVIYYHIWRVGNLFCFEGKALDVFTIS